MTEEPYRWLEAIGNRREYVREQIKTGAPAFAVRRPEGILLLGIGSGNSKVFELFDRHALAALGHPADIEKIRQAAIDAAHVEAFTRAPEDVSLRRLVSFGLSPQLKTNFEQIFSAPFLVELLLAELGPQPDTDLILRLHFDGAFQILSNQVVVVAGNDELEKSAQTWLNERITGVQDRAQIVDLLLQAWWCLTENKPFTEAIPPEDERKKGWKARLQDRVVELALLDRARPGAAKYVPLTLAQLGL
jgi:proteasome alpha subunit